MEESLLFGESKDAPKPLVPPESPATDRKSSDRVNRG
jgi:hypothetical protein